MPFKGFLGPSSEPGLLTRILRHVYILSQYSFIYNPESIFSPRPPKFSPSQPNRIAPPGSQKRGAARVYHPSSSLAYQKKPRRVCAAHGANKVQIIFGGGKWVRLQERAARLVKSNPCSAYVDKNTSRPASWVRLQTRKRSAARLVKSNPCSAVEFSRQRRENYARSRVQSPQMRVQRSGKRESKSMILLLELMQRCRI